MDLLTLLRTQWDRAAAWVSISLGGLVLVLGWVGVSGTGLTAEQIPYVISGGLGGIFLLGLGAMLWLSADMRDEWRLLEQLRRAIDEAEPAAAADHEQGDDTVMSAPERKTVAALTTNGQRGVRRTLKASSK